MCVVAVPVAEFFNQILSAFARFEALDYFLRFFCCQAGEGEVVYQRGRFLIAHADTGGFTQRDQTIRSCLAEINTCRFLESLGHLFKSHHFGDCAVVKIDLVAPQFFLAQKMIERNDTLHLDSFNLQGFGDQVDHWIGNLPVGVLHFADNVDQAVSLFALGCDDCLDFAG